MLQLMNRIVTQSVETTAGCWEWQGSRTPKGYGRVHARGKLLYVHRVAYEALIAEIPEGLQLDHLCRNRACVNPWHLEPVTNRVNTSRGRAGTRLASENSGKTHCPQGHPYSGDNLRIGPHGWRYCRTCRREQKRKSNATRAT
jgi:hypothetical protein